MSGYRRGSTPTHTFNVNVDLRNATVYVTYSQRGVTIVEKTGEDLTITQTTVALKLTQSETLQFSNGRVEIQIRYVMADGSADASNIIVADAQKILKDGVITYAV